MNFYIYSYCYAIKSVSLVWIYLFIFIDESTFFYNSYLSTSNYWFSTYIDSFNLYISSARKNSYNLIFSLSAANLSSSLFLSPSNADNLAFYIIWSYFLISSISNFAFKSISFFSENLFINSLKFCSTPYFFFSISFLFIFRELS